MPSDIAQYNQSLTEKDQRICDLLAKQIDRILVGANSKIWHRQPVWFLNGNPIVGYSKLKNCIQLLFWSGQSFEETILVATGKFKAAEIRYTEIENIDLPAIERCLQKSKTIQWDYKNIVKRKGKLEKLDIMERIQIQANIAADRDTVWDYYTNPKHIVHWNFASDDWCCPSAENDMRIGGRYKARMEAKDGSFGFDLEAIYSQIEPLESYSYAMADRKVDALFISNGSTTDVIVTFDPETENPIEMQRDGWQAILNNFKKYVEKG